MSAEPLTNGAVDLAIGGMTCSGCVKAVTRAVSQVPGVTTVEVDLAGGRARIAGQAGLADLVAAVEQAGFEARPVQGSARE